MKKLYKNQDGTIILLFAFSMLLFIAMLAMVIDAGSLYLEKAKMQQALDESVRAGVVELPQRADRAQAAAYSSLNKNSVLNSEAQFNFNVEYSAISGVAKRKGKLYFAKALGFQAPDITVFATAQIGSLSSGIGAVPLGLNANTPVSFGTQVKLKVGPASANGDFGALVLSGPGANEYEYDLTYGYRSKLSVNQLLSIQTGNIAGPTQKAVKYRLSLCPLNGSATYLDHPDNCPLIVLIPVYSTIPENTSQVKTVGFAAFFLESVGPINEGSPITGRFLRHVFPGDFTSGLKNYGAYAHKLVK